MRGCSREMAIVTRNHVFELAILNFTYVISKRASPQTREESYQFPSHPLQLDY